MPFKINISEKGKTFKLEADNESLIGLKIGEKIEGKELKKELEGYELEITGTSDIAGFPGFKEIEGSGLQKMLLTYGKGMHKKPRREGKKPTASPRGLRLKKSVRGNTISKNTIQINIKVLKSGSKKLEEIFPEQNKGKEKPEELRITEENKQETK
jgi:small subunit ribosomal protein S6e